MNVLRNCRICKSSDLENIIFLGSQYITSRFPVYGDFTTPKTDITLCICNDCYLLQLSNTTPSNELYEYEYGYRSGISNTMRKHLKDYNEEILSKVTLNKGDTILDIGSNDATMLKYYSDGYNRIGVDPTGIQFKEYYGDVKLIDNYFTLHNFETFYPGLKCKIVSSISMFYDLPDPVQFAKDIYSVLDDNGIWTCEQSYVISMLNTNSIDTICHEHLEYYSIHNIKKIADLSNFKIIDIKFNDCNGGSFRIYLAKKNSGYSEYSELEDLLYNEKDKISREKYIKFVDNCDFEIEKLKKFINILNKNGKKVYIYGASTKGNCLLQYGNITEKDVPFAVERNLKKVGKMTSTGIPIISEETMRNSPPDYLLVLPWHFRNEIIERESEFLNNGGQFIFPFPNFEIVSTKKKVLITGCDGMIANYFIKNNDYSFYGIGNKKENYDSKVLKFYHLNYEWTLEFYLLIVKPDIIIHLAGISNSKYALENPVETMNTNGLMACKLCDIIHRNKLNTKLFNASSSEIYKGHINYFVEDSNSNSNSNSDFKHSHPYSIAKIMSHSIIDFYRNTYNLPFSNGILFTTESPLKSKEFLLNKVAYHIKNRLPEPLNVGNLDSYRNIIHASDVASAINIIISQNYGDNYVISGNESNKMVDLVNLMYNLSGIEPNLIMNDYGNENIPTNINGESVKLKNLGWNPVYSVNDIIKELLI